MFSDAPFLRDRSMRRLLPFLAIAFLVNALVMTVRASAVRSAYA